MKQINIDGIKEYYFIDEDGNVYSMGRSGKKILSPNKDKDGYLRVSLQSKDGRRKSYRVNRLVALTFIPNPENFPVVNHKDGHKDNNNVNNLEWCSISYNTLEGYKMNDYHFKKKD